VMIRGFIWFQMLGRVLGFEKFVDSTACYGQGCAQFFRVIASCGWIWSVFVAVC
jgi:hypothetical protein